MQLRPKDWIKYLLPELSGEEFAEIKSEKVLRLNPGWMRFADWCSKAYLFAPEPQGYRDTALPARMLRYRADIWEYNV